MCANYNILIYTYDQVGKSTAYEAGENEGWIFCTCGPDATDTDGTCTSGCPTDCTDWWYTDGTGTGNWQNDDTMTVEEQGDTVFYCYWL